MKANVPSMGLQETVIAYISKNVDDLIEGKERCVMKREKYSGTNREFLDEDPREQQTYAPELMFQLCDQGLLEELVDDILRSPKQDNRAFSIPDLATHALFWLRLPEDAESTRKDEMEVVYRDMLAQMNPEKVASEVLTLG